MSAMAELAANLVEYGGPIHTHDGWLARTADGRMVDGYRYALRDTHRCGAGCGASCPGWRWQYVGRAFAEHDAVTVLVEILTAAVCAEHWRAIWGALPEMADQDSTFAPGVCSVCSVDGIMFRASDDARYALGVAG